MIGTKRQPILANGADPVLQMATACRDLSALDRQRSRTLSTALLALIAAFVIPPFVGLDVSYSSFLPLLALPLTLLLIGWYLRRRGLPDLLGAVEGVALAITLSVPILVLSYAAMRLNLPLADARLAAWDTAFGFSAARVVTAVGNMPWLASMLGVSYSSFSLQLVAIPALLVLAGQTSRGYWFIEAFLLTCIASIAITTFFPALGSYSHYALDRAAMGAVNPFFGYHFLDSFYEVRNDPDFILSLGAASGVVTFPSIHAAIAVLCAYAAWSVCALRIPFLVLNIAMFASAITHGAHYFVDAAAGAIVALAIIGLRGPMR